MSVDTTQNQAISQDAPKDNSAATNLRQIARQLEEERAVRVQLQEELKHEREQKARKPYKDDDDDEVSDEPYIDRRTLKKEMAKTFEQIRKETAKDADERVAVAIEKERQQSFLKSNPDFKEILSPEFIQKFAEKHPEIADPMLEMPDNFARQKLLYQNIKALGVNKPTVTQPSIQQKIDANRKSPYYQPSGGNTPPYASTGDFSDGGQKNAYAKMQELIKGRRAL